VFIQSLSLAWSLSSTLEGSKNQNSAETQQRPSVSPKFTSNQPLSHYGKLFEKLLLRTIQKHTEERNLLNASQFGFRVGHSTALQCMRLVDHVTLNFNNNMSGCCVL
jgi:hypothetical protein